MPDPAGIKSEPGTLDMGDLPGNRLTRFREEQLKRVQAVCSKSCMQTPMRPSNEEQPQSLSVESKTHALLQGRTLLKRRQA